jgi:hypothetical protein
MSRDVLYDDGRVMLDGEGVTLRGYYFPHGASRHIPYRRIQGVQVQPMGWLSGKGRMWGTADPRYWLPLDVTRPHKDKLLVLDLGCFVKPGFTPDEPDRVLKIVQQHIRRS